MLALAAGALIATMPAHAQTAAAPATGTASDSSDKIATVIVTARKREERLIDVPSSIATVSGAQIKATSAERVSDLANYIPNVAISADSPLDTVIQIRGIGESAKNIGFDSTAGVYLDGIYLGPSPSIEQELLNIDQVEVLRGPQGALFGKNTIAGAINLITTRPSNYFNGDYGVGIGNLGLREGHLRVTGPLAQGVEASLAVQDVGRKGYIDNILTGKDGGSRDAFSYRGQLQIDRFDHWKIYATFDGLESREYAAPAKTLSDTFGTSPDIYAPGYNQVAYNTYGPDRRHIMGTSLDVTYDFASGFKLRSITSARNTQFKTSFDIDDTPADIMYIAYSDRYQQYTQEVQLLSPTGGKLNYVLGLYYYLQDASSSRTANIGADGALFGQTPGNRVSTFGTLDTDNEAVFGNATYDFTSRLQLSAGFRLSKETKTVDFTTDGTELPYFDIATGHITGKHVDNDFSPTATLTYKFGLNSNVYVRYAEGYKSGGYNLDFLASEVFPKGLEFNKENVRNYEAGIKSVFWGGRAFIDADIFRSDFVDYQLPKYVDLGGGSLVQITGNAGQLRSQGLELEGTIKPVHGLTIRTGLGLLDPRFVKYYLGDSAGTNYNGIRLPSASKVQFMLGGDYVRNLGGDLKVTTSMQYAYRSDYYIDTNYDKTISVGSEQVPFNYVKGRSTLDGRIALASTKQNWELAIWGRNLTNAIQPVSYGYEFLGARLRIEPEPRTYGVTLSSTF